MCRPRALPAGLEASQPIIAHTLCLGRACSAPEPSSCSSARSSPRRRASLPTIFEDAAVEGFAIAPAAVPAAAALGAAQLEQLLAEQPEEEDLLLAAVEARLQQLLLIKEQRLRQRQQQQQQQQQQAAAAAPAAVAPMLDLGASPAPCAGPAAAAACAVQTDDALGSFDEIIDFSLAREWPMGGADPCPLPACARPMAPAGLMLLGQAPAVAPQPQPACPPAACCGAEHQASLLMLAASLPAAQQLAAQHMYMQQTGLLQQLLAVQC